jgi:hypothetical protein
VDLELELELELCLPHLLLQLKYVLVWPVWPVY